TITFDNGAEFSSLSQVHGTDIYFAHPYSPWERGTNENTNGLLREFFPKGRSLVSASLIDIQSAQDTLNHRLRRSLNYRSPADLMPGLA
ncbi:IS30 family transposase, partial [Secundilactobacillus malefermentans]